MPNNLAAHMEERGCQPALYMTAWLLTIFASAFPLAFASRVMDVLLTDSYSEPMMKVSDFTRQIVCRHVSGGQLYMKDRGCTRQRRRLGQQPSDLLLHIRVFWRASRALCKTGQGWYDSMIRGLHLTGGVGPDKGV